MTKPFPENAKGLRGQSNYTNDDDILNQPANDTKLPEGLGVIDIRKHCRRRARGTPILFFHSWNAAGNIEYQGYLKELRADGTGVAQLFDWMLGYESDEIAFTKSFLARCTFYDNDAQMRAAYREGAQR